MKMTLTLELTPAQESFLRQRAAEAGLEPTDYLLTAAGLIPDVDGELDSSSEEETNSAYDLFRGLTGGFASGGANLSENVGRAFADGMAAKQKEGRL
jgi:hypothetical protein